MLTSCHQQGSSNAAAAMKEGQEDYPQREAITKYCNLHHATNSSTSNPVDTSSTNDGQEEEEEEQTDAETDEDNATQGVEQEAGSFTSGVLAEALRNANLSTPGDQAKAEGGKG